MRLAYLVYPENQKTRAEALAEMIVTIERNDLADIDFDIRHRIQNGHRIVELSRPISSTESGT